MSASSDDEAGNAVARETADAVSELLAFIHDRVSGPTAVGSALAITLVALGFVRDATGDRGVDCFIDVLPGAMRLRQDRLRPVPEIAP